MTHEKCWNRASGIYFIGYQVNTSLIPTKLAGQDREEARESVGEPHKHREKPVKIIMSDPENSMEVTYDSSAFDVDVEAQSRRRPRRI